MNEFKQTTCAHPQVKRDTHGWRCDDCLRTFFPSGETGAEQEAVRLREALQIAEREIERLREVVTIPLITPEAPPGFYFRVLAEHEKGLPVNAQDLINALLWRVGNQRRVIARLHAADKNDCTGLVGDQCGKATCSICALVLRHPKDRQGRRAKPGASDERRTERGTTHGSHDRAGRRRAHHPVRTTENPVGWTKHLSAHYNYGKKGGAATYTIHDEQGRVTNVGYALTLANPRKRRAAKAGSSSMAAS